MIQPDNLSDETLEYAAQLIEETSLLDMGGILARKKRDREDAELRFHERVLLRKQMATNIRAMMRRPQLSAIAVLERLASLREDGCHDAYLTDAWPLAWKGWLNIEATIICNSNSVPPETRYRIVITDRGRKVLANNGTAELAAEE